MELHHQSKYLDIYYDIQLSIQKRIWKSATSEMTVNEWKELNHIGLANLLEQKIKKVLNNTSEFYFAISPELQDWYNKEMFSHWIAAGGYKVAMVISKEMISQLSIEQNMDEPIAKFGLLTKFFATDKQAYEWLTNFD